VPEYLAKATGRSGTFTSMNFEGVTLLAGYRRSHMSEWLIAANVRQEVVAAPLRRSLLLVALLGAATLALSICLALFFGRQVTAGAAHLARQAAALGSGEEVRPPSSRLAEFATVGEALAVAGATLKERERERDQAQQALEARTHELEVVLSTVPAAVWFTYDPEVRRVIRNRFAAELMRLPTEDESALAAPSRAAGHITLMKDGRALAPGEMPLQRAMRGERIEDEEYSFAFADGSTRTLLTSATALRGDRGAIVGAVSVSLDITERKRGEDQRRLLINELNHRVKNTLATVQSIAAQTLRGATSLGEAQDALTDRLVALAKAHDILTRESWEGADLREIVTGAIATHATRDRFVVSGPSVWLTPSVGLSLALTLHELATNAVKYGALSNETGTIAIIWRLEAAPGGTRLVLCWEEGGGPPVVPPARRGFGSRLIQKSLSSETGGRAEIEYRPEGLLCTLEVSLDESVAPPEAA
jgi:two-component sensor histidine kinase